MTGKNARWQERWDVDPQQRIATHETGLRVRLEAEVGLAENASEVEQLLTPVHGAHNATAMVQRLTRKGAQLLIDPFSRGWRSQAKVAR